MLILKPFPLISLQLPVLETRIIWIMKSYMKYTITRPLENLLMLGRMTLKIAITALIFLVLVPLPHGS